ncbi:hypothetical protein QUF55_02225, partial [Clostridiaceae bacterium HSG29]|nr:hypothetical protein [Clostridiaceae bacterium HSG29]
RNSINRKSVKFIYISLITSLFFIIILIKNIENLYFLLLSIIVLYIINNQLLDFYINRIENALLTQFEVFLSEVKHYYHEHKMIDEAIYDTTVNVNKNNFEMSLHAKRMYEILTSEDVENEIDKYYDIAPNRFFKNFIALANLVQKFGDREVENKSIFLTNVNYLKQEIKYELLRKERLDHLFKSLSLISVSPIFFIKPLEKWAIVNLPELGYYYEGAYGFIIQILVFILVIGSYIFINKMKNQKKLTAYHEKTIVGKILEKQKIKRVINYLISKRYSKYLKTKKQLKKAGYNKSIEEFYFKRLILGILLFVMTVFIFLNVIAMNKQQIMNPMGIDKEVVEFDEKYLKKLNVEKFSKLEFKEYFSETEKLSKKNSNIISDRIYDKYIKYQKIYFKWWYLIIAIMNSFIGYNFPLILIEFKKRVMKMNIEDEVIQMHTIILMLMYFERISVEEVLKWMEQFAVIFKQSIGQCLNEMDSGDIEALEKLKQEELFPPFVKIVDNLINASERIPLALAFDELVLERKYFQDKRKQDTEILIEKKGVLGKLIAFLPMAFTIFFYLLVPFLLLSFNQLQNFSNQINSVL